MEVPFFRHKLSSANAGSVANVLDTPFLTSGSVGRAVEQQLCEFFDVSAALLTNSWTNGAVATLLALGIKPGDEVIVPAMTFIATANVVELLGGKVIFVDVDPDTLVITPELIEAAITNKTRVVIPVHLYGQMCDMKAIQAVVAKHANIAIIEDCAHCFEGQRENYRPGAYSDAAIFSFYATKNITCGEGGAIITRNQELAKKLAKTRLHGMSAGAVDRFKKGAYRHWDMDCLGVKANLPDLLAALLPDQITTIEATLADRTRLANNYRTAFADLPIRVQGLAEDVVSAEHIFPIHVKPDVRDEAINLLNSNGVQVAVNYRSVPTLTYYQERYNHQDSDFPVSSDWGHGTLSLPFYPDMPDNEQQYVIETVKRVVVPICE